MPESKAMMQTRDAAIREWLDSGTVDEAALRRNLSDIRRINVLLGWTRFTTAAVARVVQQNAMRTLTVIDVAAGSADMVIAIANWANGKGIKVDLLATDVNPHIVTIAREQVAGIRTVRVDQQDALARPYALGTFDIALCTLALHHFDPPDATTVLRNMRHVARHVLVFDVVRSPLAYAGAVVLTRAARMDAMTRHDARASVRRAYSRNELASMAEAAGLRRPRVWVGFPFRLALVAEGDA